MNDSYISIRRWVIISIFIAWAVLFAYNKLSARQPDITIPEMETTQVTMKNHAFVPESVTVPVNTTVTWMNNDEMMHTVTSDGGSFTSGSINNGQTFSYQFKTAGVYKYHCLYHEQMIATVTVR